jgi:ABC-type phosphate transport system substrate-binding protein
VNQLRAIAVAGLLAATFLPAAAAEISGVGATFTYPVYAKWADTIQKGLRSRAELSVDRFRRRN